MTSSRYGPVQSSLHRSQSFVSAGSMGRGDRASIAGWTGRTRDDDAMACRYRLYRARRPTALNQCRPFPPVHSSPVLTRPAAGPAARTHPNVVAYFQFLVQSNGSVRRAIMQRLQAYTVYMLTNSTTRFVRFFLERYFKRILLLLLLLLLLLYVLKSVFSHRVMFNR